MNNFKPEIAGVGWAHGAAAMCVIPEGAICAPVREDAQGAGDLHVVEFSHSQQAVHLTTLGESLASNCAAFAENRPADYVPLRLFASRDAASEFCAEVQRIRNLREEENR